jgi:hypothetical protein
MGLTTGHACLPVVRTRASTPQGQLTPIVGFHPPHPIPTSLIPLLPAPAGAPGSAAPELEATALITVPNRAPGETLILTGSIPALGNWDPAAGLKLEGAGNIVEGKIKLLAGTVAEAKVGGNLCVGKGPCTGADRKSF